MENQKLPNPVDLILAPVKKPEVATIDKRKSQSTPRDKQYRGGKTKGI